MNNSNRLISSDNKGLASLMMEYAENGADVLPGRVCKWFVLLISHSNEREFVPYPVPSVHLLEFGCDWVLFSFYIAGQVCGCLLPE
jgi:hypothetical protein